MTKEYIVFSNEHGILTKLGHIPDNEIIPKLILKDGHLRSMSPDYTRIHLESINNTLREGNGNPLQYSCLENPMGRRRSMGSLSRT